MDAPGSASDDPPKFTLFPKVPIELRRMIWKRAIPKGRLILVRAVERWPGGIPRDLCEPIQAGRVWKPKVSRYKVPEILTTCKEAREAAKDVYKLSFEKELRGRTIWVNFMRDTIVFEDAYALAVFQGMVGVSGAHRAVGKFHGKIPPEKTVMEKKLRHLVVYDLLDKHLIELLSRFQSLERIVLQKGAIYSGVGPGIRYLVGYEDTTHLESELMERWSKLKTLPELESGDAMDMLHEYWDTHTIPEVPGAEDNDSRS